ncbi:N-acetylglucosaminyl deacetylase, LmbE family [Lishizhenia tianjinensis]|uniref:N-acetylglucosaminyl deacetylase, LmbE family n=1 Tax=Lishizhenia tianjinensis TaxID=477690 RepID=A0A1I6XK21_9FLAO|nr:PIG-L family deacetylase [Lishizhenia tianjinensis]SFT38453.1 N-acetylglucosaminyl deacetylase, LmbE family [Lishizhenia tianjinensis]
MRRNYITQGILVLTLFFTSFAQAAQPASSIYVQVQKLHSLKRVLYVAAHPDDENTRALAWFSLGEKAETAYFSLTRGDGGQNLIGNELGDALGVLRTQELLAARSHDHAKQYFSHAVDFGYSKSAEESFQKWGKDVLMADLVLMIRRFKPDVIVTRFPPDERAGHGHHTASALLALEAFDKAADATYLPEQVKELGTWQVNSVYWNSSYWWNPSIADSAQNNPDYLVKDIGGYAPLLGQSYNEIGTLARSQHKCQGFGNLLERGEQTEYFQYLKGKKLKNSFFEHAQRDWFNLTKSNVDKHFHKLLENFNFQDPAQNIPALLEILDYMEQIVDPQLRDEKVALCKEIIAQCLGMNLELLADDHSFALGYKIPLELVAINRSSTPVRLKTLRLNDGTEIEIGTELPNNKEYKHALTTAPTTLLSTPYWLRSSHTDLYTINDEQNILRAENRAAVHGNLEVEIFGESFTLPVAADYKWRDPSYGERRRPLVIAPSLTATLDQNILIAKPGVEKEIVLTLHGYHSNYEDELSVIAPEGWTINLSKIAVHFTKKHQEQSVTLKLTPNAGAKSGELIIKDSKGNRVFDATEISYDHIPTQVIFSPAALKCIPLDLQVKENLKVAYIKGVEDDVANAIRQLGVQVDEFEVSDLVTIDLSNYTTVVLGIRIYNVHPELENFHPQIENFVKAGGNLIIQYNTASRSGDFSPFSPLPFKIGRNRVTEEDATAIILNPEHPIFTQPNAITNNDFEGWVQERGLYFAENYSPEYQALLSWADQGEAPQEGALVVAKMGEGQVVYTGISFFRELPKGVMGAYRLFANLLSY